MHYRLLDEFEGLFKGHPYLHRDSSRGDWVAMHLYEDLIGLGKSKLLGPRVFSGDRVLNVSNKRHGIKARRGDGSFGELVPNETPIKDPGFGVMRGRIANVEIGAEVKILLKAMNKQVDRVITDLKNQVSEFNHRAGMAKPICVGIVGINHAQYTTSYEGTRSYKTDGKLHKHPYQEAAKAEADLLSKAAPHFDEFIILHYDATNESPFPFAWVNATRTNQDARAVSLHQLLLAVGRGFIYQERYGF